MSKIDDYFNELVYVSEEIASYYEMLVSDEIDFNSSSYESHFKDLIDALKRENDIYIEISAQGLTKELRSIVMRELVDAPKLDIALVSGYAHLFRINNNLEKYTTDNTLAYVYDLKYKVNKIILAFLDELINNPYYGEIKEKLLLYKYSILYLYVDSEEDFINKDNCSNYIELSPTDSSRINTSKYLDYAILYIPIMQAFGYLNSIYPDDIINDSKRANIIIKFINIFACLTFVTSADMEKFYEELMDILECDDEVSLIGNEMLRIFTNMQERFIIHK